MMPRPIVPRPGDYLLDRYLPDADPEAHELARARFLAHALILERIGEAILREKPEALDSTENGIGAILESAPREPEI